MKIADLAVEHDYYCHTRNYYSNEANASWENWKEYFEEFGDAEDDMNLVFRWDIRAYDEEEEGEGYYMEIFIMRQRKGAFTPSVIESVTDEDAEQIADYLKQKKEYLLKLWEGV